MKQETLERALPRAAIRIGVPWRRAVKSAFLSTAGYVLPPAVALTLAGIGWELWVHMRDTPVYILPAPSKVLDRLFSDLGFFARQGWTTLYEAVLGFFLGSSVAVLGAIVMAHSRLLERGLFPLAVLVKVVPMVAVAPLFVIWFGFGPMPKVAVAALITFFPVLVNAITGFRAVHPNALAFLQSLHASGVEVFLKLRVPSSLPYLFSAFKVAVPLSVIGAVVGEFFGASKGLGHLIVVANNNLDMPTLFAAIISLAILGITLVLLLSVLEKRLLFWHESLRTTEREP
jgi:NitT/TauT family transport system permease protein